MLFISQAPAVEKARQPNIVFILADDMGYGDPQCYNKDSKIPTPNMNRLAAQGMRFTDAHTPSAVCSPTRYAVLTGRYAWRTSMKRGVLNGYSPALIEASRLTVAALLKRLGYATAGIGCGGTLAWAISNRPTTRPSLSPVSTAAGFDYFFGIPASLDMPPYVYVENDHAVELPTAKIGDSAMRRHGGEGFWRGGAIAPSFKHIDVLPVLTEKAVGYLEKQAKQASGQPFFLYLALTAPHTPWLPTDKFRGKSGAGYYGDFTAQVDWTVGQVLETLERLNLADNTLVILTSDNGAHWLPEDIRRWGHLANLLLRGQKADIWEGGHRVPFIARWPGKVPAGRTSDETICLVDFLATCAAIGGVSLPDNAGEDSFNLLPVLLGKRLERPVREATVHHSGNGLFGIRQGDWVFIDGLGSGGFSAPRTEEPRPGGPTGQLYNLVTDPGEQNNQFLQRPEIVARLRTLLQRYQQEGRSRPKRGA